MSGRHSDQPVSRKASRRGRRRGSRHGGLRIAVVSICRFVGLRYSHRSTAYPCHCDWHRTVFGRHPLAVRIPRTEIHTDAKIRRAGRARAGGSRDHRCNCDRSVAELQHLGGGDINLVGVAVDVLSPDLCSKGFCIVKNSARNKAIDSLSTNIDVARRNFRVE